MPVNEPVLPALHYPAYQEGLLAPGRSALWADQYALTMAQAFFADGRHNLPSTFHAFVRTAPFGGSYVVTGGQAVVFEWLAAHWRFDDTDIALLRAETVQDTQGTPVRLFTDAFLDFIAREPLRLTVDAMPEGEIAFADEPIYRVHGPLWQCLMVEAAILNVTASQSLFATLSSHLVELAGAAPILEFGLRRGQAAGGLDASRGAWLGGAPGVRGGGMVGTSNMLARKMYGIPGAGTMGHALVMAYDTELEAFAAYARAMPHNGVFLVDTYQTVEGVRRAIAACRSLGIALKGVRLDSGDMQYLSREARRLLDEAGYTDARIIASDSLSYKAITKLQADKAPVDTYAIGGYMVTSPDQPGLNAVYKLGAVANGGVTQEEIDAARRLAAQGLPFNLADGAMRRVIKLSEVAAKVTIPGELDVIRYLAPTRDGLRFDGDTIVPFGAGYGVGDGQLTRSVVSVEKMDDVNSREFPAGTRAYRPLVRVFEGGQMVVAAETVHHGRARAQARLALLEPSHKGMPARYPYRVGIEHGLFEDRKLMIRDMRRNLRGA